jgi:myo-inositol-1(or 4)-monophosphatase
MLRKTKSERSFMIKDSPLLDIAIEASQKASRQIIEGLSASYTIKTKTNPQDLITEYDNLAEETIINTIKSKYPNHHFLAEESGYSGTGPCQVLWIIDPIDGTMNFAHQFPWFAVNIAAVVDGVVEIALTHNPVGNEIFTAARGQGAYLNGKRIKVSNNMNLPQALLSAGFPYGISDLRDRAVRQFAQFATLGNPIRLMGSAALSLAYVAAGILEAHWGYSLKPWDIAPGMLLIEEAGGTITCIDGTPISPTESANVVATNKILHMTILEHLR